LREIPEIIEKERYQKKIVSKDGKKKK